jgi:hypothetical protein
MAAGWGAPAPAMEGNAQLGSRAGGRRKAVDRHQDRIKDSSGECGKAITRLLFRGFLP